MHTSLDPGTPEIHLDLGSNHGFNRDNTASAEQRPSPRLPRLWSGTQ